MKLSRRATGVFTFFSILLFAGAATDTARCQGPDSIYTIPKGTEIRVRMDSEISSKSSSVNDTFTTTISSPVLIRGYEALPIGTVIEGKITGVKTASLGKKSGSFEIKFETLYLANGVKRQIDGGITGLEKPKTSPTGKSLLTIVGTTGAGAAIGTAVEKTKGALIGAMVGFGVGASAVFLRKGKEARIKAGEEFSIVLHRDVTLPPQDY